MELSPGYENHMMRRICDLPLGAGVGVGVGVGIVMITEKKGKSKTILITSIESSQKAGGNQW